MVFLVFLFGVLCTSVYSQITVGVCMDENCLDCEYGPPVDCTGECEVEGGTAGFVCRGCDSIGIYLDETCSSPWETISISGGCDFVEEFGVYLTCQGKSVYEEESEETELIVFSSIMALVIMGTVICCSVMVVFISVVLVALLSLVLLLCFILGMVVFVKILTCQCGSRNSATNSTPTTTTNNMINVDQAREMVDVQVVSEPPMMEILDDPNHNLLPNQEVRSDNVKFAFARNDEQYSGGNENLKTVE